MELTLAIPTYNRNETLRENLGSLLPQLTPECKLLIVDNCSPTPIAETVSSLIALYPNLDVQIVRNPVNIGGNANILRCIELCDTPWIWILGDDDKVHPHAVDTVLHHIGVQNQCVLLNFACDDQRTRSYLTRGLLQLAEEVDKSANLPWISSSIYKAEAVRPYLKFGYQHCYALLPHLATLFMAIGEEGTCYFSRQQIVERESWLASPEQQWSLLNFALGFPTLLDLPLSPRVRELLAHKLLLTHQGQGIHLRGLTFQLLLTALKERDHRNALYYYDQICARAFYFHGTRRKVELLGGRFLIRYPQLIRSIFKLVRGREIGEQNFQDRYERV